MSNINHPKHYNQSNIECIAALQSCLSPEEFKGFCIGNSIKYIWRNKQKGGIEDLKKAKWYLDYYLELEVKDVIHSPKL